ncbi:MAG TPA: glycine cleavage system protein GcvH [Candidatus Aquicultor sp.]|jgi:glycine cleavage system H protein
MIPEDLKYYKEHEWVRAEDNTATIGITDYAQDSLGDIVYVDLPEPGKQVSAGDVAGEIESVKSTAELHTPVSGTIIEVNKSVADAPEVINDDSYGKGWLFKIRFSNPSEADGLMSAQEYEEYIKGL